MSKIHLTSLLLVLSLLAVCSACSSGGFKIDGNLSGLNRGEVRIVFNGDSGIVDEWVGLDKKGKFSYKGIASQPILVNIMDHSNKILATVAVTAGDHIKIKGDASKAMGVKVKGNHLNEEWQLFRDEHAAFYTDANPSRLNAAIEKYVTEHPADMLSTVLLVADYSDFSDGNKVEKMLNSIDAKVRPKSLTKDFLSDPLRGRRTNLPRLMSLTLWKYGGGFEEVKLAGAVMLLSFWASPQPDRAAMTEKLNAFVDKTEGKVSVIDVLAASDTLRWHRFIADESWPHYWAPAGPMEQGVESLGITSLPWFALSDSTGLIVYSGPSFTDVSKKALDIFGIK